MRRVKAVRRICETKIIEMGQQKTEILRGERITRFERGHELCVFYTKMRLFSRLTTISERQWVCGRTLVMQVSVRVRVNVVRRMRRTPQQPLGGGQIGPRIQFVAAIESHRHRNAKTTKRETKGAEKKCVRSAQTAQSNDGRINTVSAAQTEVIASSVGTAAPEVTKGTHKQQAVVSAICIRTHEWNSAAVTLRAMSPRAITFLRENQYSGRNTILGESKRAWRDLLSSSDSTDRREVSNRSMAATTAARVAGVNQAGI
jgi:hypothetical protein